MAYEVVRRLGRGGMGVVDLAVDAHGRPVALKRLPLHGSAAEITTARARIRREAEVLRALDHPAIVRLLDVVDEGDDLVLVMPYLPGGTLHERVGRDGPLPPSEVKVLGDRLLDGLAAAHRQGIVHRDIKPANVLFDADGQAHLVDFGVASTRDHTVGLTAAETVVGTPGFMAPEQARGEPATPASDVFSLGATLLYAATGNGPYGGAQVDPRVLMHRAAGGKVERLPRELPTTLRDRLTPMLDRNADRRPSAASARGGPAGTWPRAVAAPGGVRWAQLRPIAIGLVVALLLVGGAIAVLADDGRPKGRVLGPGTSTTAARSTTTTTVPCEPLPFRPCGPDGPGPVAPFTDGRVCVDDHADYDGDPENGCEAAPDGVPADTPLETTLRANLVPDTDVDEWTVPVSDNFQVLCDGALHVGLTAPAGVSMRLELLDPDGEVLARTASADGVESRVSIGDPQCAFDDGTSLTARVSWIGSDRSAEDYVLTRSGSF